MPQLQLPIFPAGTCTLNHEIAFECRDGRVAYFNGHLPVFVHDESDVASFRLFTSQLVVGGTVSQAEIVRAFGVPAISVKRSVAKLRSGGPQAFYVPPERRRGHKLTPERLAEAQSLLEEGLLVSAVSQKLAILKTTLHKAIDSGRLRLKKTALRTQRRKSKNPVPKPDGV